MLEFDTDKSQLFLFWVLKWPLAHTTGARIWYRQKSVIFILGSKMTPCTHNRCWILLPTKVSFKNLGSDMIFRTLWTLLVQMYLCVQRMYLVGPQLPDITTLKRCPKQFWTKVWFTILYPKVNFTIPEGILLRKIIQFKIIR